MEKYIEQLIADIAHATENVSLPFVERDLQLQDWLTEEEENKIAPVRNLEEWTGISKVQLPPPEMLSIGQVNSLLEALKKMLDAYNCSFVLQTIVPEVIQYSCIRDNFNQEVRVRQWHMGFFENCREGTEHGKCALENYCQCAFFADMFSEFIEEDLTLAEERARELACEIKYIKRKHGDEWMKYYPYHLDSNYDDENGNPYNYDFPNEEEDDNDSDDWWRR
jgi:hypothetical protein